MEIKFLNDKKNKFIVCVSLVLIILGLVIFFATYTITYNFSKSNNNLNFVNKNGYENSLKVNTKEIVLVSENTDGEYSEKSRIRLELSDINKVFKDMYPIGEYEIIDFNDDSIILKEVSKQVFDPNMYYIGEKNGYITVFKTDNLGNLFVEDEISDVSSKNVNSLPISDRELVVNYKLKSNEKEEIQDILSELET